MTVTADSGAQMIHYAESMGMLQRQKHPLGDIMRMNAENAVLATYYRNNILHLFAMPSLLACAFVSNARMRTADIQRLVWRVYPYISAELFLRWDETEVSGVADVAARDVRAAQSAAGQRRSQRVAASAADIARGHPAVGAGAGDHSNHRALLPGDRVTAAGGQRHASRAEALEERCHLMAQRMSVLYGLNSPEFFDKSLFRNFIELLRRRDVIQMSRRRKVAVRRSACSAVAADAQLVLSEQIRHSILQVTLGQ